MSTHAASRILVVDDEPDVRTIVVTLLESDGYAVANASSGEECIDQVKADPPDLIILDIMMPEMDGLEVMVKLKDVPASSGIPIIVLTVLGGSALFSEETLKSHGADRVLRKPFEPEELSRAVEQALGR